MMVCDNVLHNKINLVSIASLNITPTYLQNIFDVVDGEFGFFGFAAELALNFLLELLQSLGHELFVRLVGFDSPSASLAGWSGHLVDCEFDRRGRRIVDVFGRILVGAERIIRLFGGSALRIGVLLAFAHAAGVNITCEPLAPFFDKMPKWPNLGRRIPTARREILNLWTKLVYVWFWQTSVSVVCDGKKRKWRYR